MMNARDRAKKAAPDIFGLIEDIDPDEATGTTRTLIKNGIKTVDDLMVANIEDIANMYGIGLKKLNIIRQIRNEVPIKGHSIGMATSILTGEPCSWKQRCEELERIIYKRYVLQHTVNDIDDILYQKLGPTCTKGDKDEHRY